MIDVAIKVNEIFFISNFGVNQKESDSIHLWKCDMDTMYAFRPRKENLGMQWRCFRQLMRCEMFGRSAFWKL